MSFLVKLADRVLNRPLLITPEKAQVVLSVLGGRIGVDTPRADRFEGDHFERDEDGRARRMLAYPATEDGIAIISIVGSLVNRGAYIGASSGLVSYEGVKHQLKQARQDERIRAVILDIQSPGGEAIGAFEAAEQVRLLAEEKPVIAVINGMAASAAYAIASGATEIVTTPSGVSGSIGVVLLHVDMSVALDAEGTKPTLIFAGAHKVDGNPFEPLSEQVRGSLQAEVDSLYEAFLTTVAAGRGDRLTVDMARATAARTFYGQSDDPNLSAIANGLADRVGTFETVLADLSRAGGRQLNVQPRGTLMGTENSAPAAENAGISQADHDAAVETAAAEGRKAGAEAERSRLLAVVSAEEISGDAARMAAGIELACEAPDLAAEKVVSMTAKHVSSAPNGAGMSLAERQTDADPLGSADGGAKTESGLSRMVGKQVEKMTAGR